MLHNVLDYTGGDIFTTQCYASVIGPMPLLSFTTCVCPMICHKSVKQFLLELWTFLLLSNTLIGPALPFLHTMSAIQ